jgi:solute carrier family 35 protein E3
MSSARFIFWAGLSIGSSVGIILINKSIMSYYAFNYVFTLTTLHFLTQAILMEILVMASVIKPAKLPNKDNLLTAACGVASIVFMNFNLRFNSVGFYQMTKLLCIPLIVFIETKYYGKVFSGKIKFSLMLVLAGVGITAVTDLLVNRLGLVFGAIAVFSTTQFQIWQGSKQEQYKIQPIQITHSVSFPMALICGVCAAVFEGVYTDDSVLDHEFDGMKEIGMIFLSCCFAILVNICSFTLIGKFSAVTYQVIGHMKTILVLVGGLLMFKFNGTTRQLMNNLSGIVLAMIGVILYGHLKSASAGNSDWLDQFFPNFFVNALKYFDGRNAAVQTYEMVDNDNKEKVDDKV